MLIWCSNKGCGKSSDAVLDKNDNEVYCVECDKVITNITAFTKATLKSLNQTRKPTKEPLAMKCASCKNEQLPGLKNDKFVCRKCQKEMQIGKTFEPLIMKAIKEKESGSK